MSPEGQPWHGDWGPHGASWQDLRADLPSGPALPSLCSSGISPEQDKPKSLSQGILCALKLAPTLSQPGAQGSWAQGGEEDEHSRSREEALQASNCPRPRPSAG